MPFGKPSAKRVLCEGAKGMKWQRAGVPCEEEMMDHHLSSSQKDLVSNKLNLDRQTDACRNRPTPPVGAIGLGVER